MNAGGDFNGDGLQDLFIGAPGENSKGNSTGAAYLVYGSATQTYTKDLGSADLIFEGENSVDYAGNSLSYSEDLDGDGLSDLLVGSQGYNASVGTSYIIYSSVPSIKSVEVTNHFWIGSYSSAYLL